MKQRKIKVLTIIFIILLIVSPVHIKAAGSTNSYSTGVVDIAAGGAHSLAILSDGRLFSWGDNSNGQLGNGTTDNKNTPIEIELDEGVKPVKIACGFNHSLAIGDNGCLYAWGANYDGQLGNGTTEDSYIPVKIKFPNNSKVVQIACGDDFSMAICDDGSLYTWGNNDDGQLGNGSNIEGQYRSTPTLIKLSGNVNPIKISCGSKYAMAIGDDGYIYGWGDNYNYQQSDGSTSYYCASPKIIAFSKDTEIKVNQISCGYSHVITLSCDNKLYGWGDHSSGQLGDIRRMDDDYSHNKMYYKLNFPADTKINSIVSDSSHSTAIIDQNGSLYMSGWNFYGQLGNGNREKIEKFSQINFATKGIKATKVAFGYSHTLILADNGKVYTSGSNTYGELGDGSNSLSCTFKSISFSSNNIVDEPTLSVSYRTHVQSYGWQDYVSDGIMSGTEGKAKRLEAININVSESNYSGGISYKTHVQKIGWQNWVSNGALSGTQGRALRLEAIQIKLTDELAEHYDIYYRVHAQHFGWMGWAKNGAAAGTAGYAYRLEGIQIVIVPKGDLAPGSTTNCYISK